MGTRRLKWSASPYPQRVFVDASPSLRTTTRTGTWIAEGEIDLVLEHAPRPTPKRLVG